MIDWKTLINPDTLTEEDDVALSDRPRRFKVMLYNDDYTPMEFVVNVIRAVFGYDESLATTITMKVHYEGQASCGVFEEQEAKVKAADVTFLARDESHPLLCLAEPCENEEDGAC